MSPSYEISPQLLFLSESRIMLDFMAEMAHQVSLFCLHPCYSYEQFMAAVNQMSWVIKHHRFSADNSASLYVKMLYR